MFKVDFDDSIILHQKKVLEAALTSNPRTKKWLQKLIRQALMDVRPDMVSAVRRNMKRDPRGASEGIRLTVYKKILGGNINVLNMKRKRGKPTTYVQPRKLDQNPRQRGGNRVVRGKRTADVLTYGPHDRGWILRILNSGTSERMAGTRGGKLSGKRGNIEPRNFFSSAASTALQKAAVELDSMIDTELNNMLNGKAK